MCIEARTFIVNQGGAEVTLAVQSTEAALKEEEGEMLDWRTELEAYLKEGTLPTDPKIALTMVMGARHFILVEGILFKKSFGRLLL